MTKKRGGFSLVECTVSIVTEIYYAKNSVAPHFRIQTWLKIDAREMFGS